jgi:flagellar protein FliL
MASESEQHKSPGGFMQLAMALVVVSAVGAGAGFGMGPMLIGDQKPKEEKKHKPAAAITPDDKQKAAEKPAHGAEDATATAEIADETADDLAEFTVVPFPVVLTNIAAPHAVWIRLEGSVMVRKESEASPEILAAGAAQQILSYLRTIQLADLQGANGLYDLTEDLNEVMRSFSKGEVRRVLLSGMIVE